MYQISIKSNLSGVFKDIRILELDTLLKTHARENASPLALLRYCGSPSHRIST